MSLLHYIAVGGFATGCHYLLLIGLVEIAGLDATVATFLGACVGAGVAFFGQCAITFASRPHTTAALPRFLAVATMGAVLNSAIVWLGNILGLHYLIAQLIATIIVVFLTFLLNSHWSFA